MLAMSRHLTLAEAALAIGVSVDTLRRWERSDRLQTERDVRNHHLVSESEVQGLSGRAVRHRTGTPNFGRNRLTGVVRSVESNGVMALVELEAGPFVVTAAITRASMEQLRLAPGVQATAVVKATSVMIELNVAGRGATESRDTRTVRTSEPAADETFQRNTNQRRG